MYHDFAGREIEDLEMDNMRRDAREQQEDSANYTAFVLLMKENRPIPDNLYHWFKGRGGNYIMDLSETLYASAFHYLINHNALASDEVWADMNT